MNRRWDKVWTAFNIIFFKLLVSEMDIDVVSVFSIQSSLNGFEAALKYVTLYC